VTGGQWFAAGFLVGVLAAGLPAFWWAVLRRAHADYRGAKAAVPGLRKARTTVAKKLVQVSLLLLVALAVAGYAAARSMK
jgi:hypothetical protein